MGLDQVYNLGCRKIPLGCREIPLGCRKSRQNWGIHLGETAKPRPTLLK